MLVKFLTPAVMVDKLVEKVNNDQECKVSVICRLPTI